MTDKPNRRKWSNIFVYPVGQIRMAFAIPMTFTIAVAILLRAMKVEMLHQAQLIGGLELQQVEQLQTLVVRTFSLGMGLTLIFGAIISFIGLVFSHRVYGPLVPVTRVIRQLRDGDHTGRVHLRRKDELGDLANAVNELAEKLEKPKS